MAKGFTKCLNVGEGLYNSVNVILQMVQNAAARFLSGVKKHQHITQWGKETSTYYS